MRRYASCCWIMVRGKLGSEVIVQYLATQVCLYYYLFEFLCHHRMFEHTFDFRDRNLDPIGPIRWISIRHGPIGIRVGTSGLAALAYPACRYVCDVLTNRLAQDTN